jgi:hypothetical protein
VSLVFRAASAAANAPNALIIPDTVPNNPISVPKETNEEIIVMFFCNIGISSDVASSISE